jgi:hypothetical protein
MFKRLKRWLVVGLNAVPLSPEQRRLLVEKAKGIDPEVLKQICVFEFQDSDPQCPDNTSTESP